MPQKIPRAACLIGPKKERQSLRTKANIGTVFFNDSVESKQLKNRGMSEQATSLAVPVKTTI